MTLSPLPFRIPVDLSEIDDLTRRVHRAHIDRRTRTNGWAYGMDSEYLTSLKGYWLEHFDWGARALRLNDMPQFTADVGGTTIHFVHARGRGPRPLPLLISHGWPATFAEMERLIPLLADPASYGGDATDAFDVVVPSLPGFAYSPELSGGSNPHEIAALWSSLMRDVLGYGRYGAHGGDIGANVTARLARTDPAVVGIHLTWVSGSFVVRHLGAGEPPLTAHEQEYGRQFAEWGEREGAYAHLQRTKPDLLAAALNDSPIGLAAWLADKFRSWSDCAGDLSSRFSHEDVLTATMLYWTTESIASSMRIYHASATRPWRLAAGERVNVPTAVALFRDGIPHPPREWAERVYRVTRWNVMPRGGHFPAHEEPELLAADIREHFRGLR